jgi:hypothetical protein
VSEIAIKSSLKIRRRHRRHDLNPAKALSAGGREDQKERSLTLSSDPIDQTRSIEQRRCLIEELLHVECDFQALLMKPRTQASAARDIPAALSSRLRISFKYVLIVVSANCGSIGVNSFAARTHASRAGEVERNLSNLVAHFQYPGRRRSFFVCEPVKRKLVAEFSFTWSRLASPVLSQGQSIQDEVNIARGVGGGVINS